MNHLTALCFFVLVVLASGQKPADTTAAPAAAPAPVPVIVWGQCPQLEPSEADKKSKAKVLEDCLKMHPIPKEVTEASIRIHQKQIAECALQKEDWFDKDGAYKFDKAASEIKKKNLSKPMEDKLLAAHEQCQKEAKEMFKDKVKEGVNAVEQVQFYQSCMDFHITKSCEIKIETPTAKPAQA